MATLHIARSPFLGISRNCPLSTSSFHLSDKSLLKVRRHSKFLDGRYCRIYCRLEDGEKDVSNGEEPPESLFMKELKKRGITPASLLEESKSGRSGLGGKEMEKENSGALPKRNAVSTDYDKSIDNQRERSMALNSEGIEGLIPRAKVLLTIGGTFFIGFWPLILGTVGFFVALYVYLGPSFVHDASKISTGPPPYIDPYKLLEDERLSDLAPNVK